MTVRPPLHRPLFLLAVLPALVTAAVYVPQLLTDSGQMSRVPGALRLGWLAMLMLAAPVVAAVLNRQWRVPMSLAHAAAVGLPQLAVLVALVRLDVWLEVRTGYLLPDSGEEAMAYGFGGVASIVAGLVLAGLVVLAASLVSRRATVGHA